MFGVRFHGRGGQGVVTAAEVLSLAAFNEGFYAQAFPTFGSERTGAPVVSFCRLDVKPIRTREPIVEPDAVIVQDPTLLHRVDVFGGISAEAFVVINTSRSAADLGVLQLAQRLGPSRFVTVPATEIARTELGRPLPNAALLGAFAALSRRVGMPAVRHALHERFPGESGLRNIRAAEAAYDHVDGLVGSDADA